MHSLACQASAFAQRCRTDGASFPSLRSASRSGTAPQLMRLFEGQRVEMLDDQAHPPADSSKAWRPGAPPVQSRLRARVRDALNQSRMTTVSKELLIVKPPLYSMNPSFR